jgi:hypothetical protein
VERQQGSKAAGSSHVRLRCLWGSRLSLVNIGERAAKRSCATPVYMHGYLDGMVFVPINTIKIEASTMGDLSTQHGNDSLSGRLRSDNVISAHFP